MLDLRNTDKEGNTNKLNNDEIKTLMKGLNSGDVTENFIPEIIYSYNDQVIDRNFPPRRIYYGRVYYG